MATKTAFPPDVTAALQSQTKFANQAKKATDQFASFAGPPGRYFARLQRITITFDKTDRSAVFNFFNTCLAAIPDSASSSAIPDQKWAGSAMKIRQGTKATENTTKQEQWERAMVCLQAYGVKTRNFGVRNGQEAPEFFLQDMADAVDLLNERRPAVIIDVNETEGKGKNQGKKYKNCNVRDLVDEELVSRLSTAQIEVSDEDMELPDDEEQGDLIDGPSGPMTPELAVVAIAALSRAEIIGALEEEKVDAGKPIQSLSDAELREVSIAFLTKTTIPQFGSVPSFVPSTSVTPTTDDEEEDDTTEDPVLKLQLHLGTLSRDAIKTAIRANGGLKPDEKFSKSKTDDELRQWLLDLKTGKLPPVAVKVPDNIPF